MGTVSASLGAGIVLLGIGFLRLSAGSILQGTEFVRPSTAYLLLGIDFGTTGYPLHSNGNGWSTSAIWFDSPCYCVLSTG